MKSSNLAWRIEPRDEPVDAPPARTVEQEPYPGESLRARPSVRFERRRIEIRDQGFAPFRVR
jgi:hypothetical protein